MGIKPEGSVSQPEVHETEHWIHVCHTRDEAHKIPEEQPGTQQDMRHKDIPLLYPPVLLFYPPSVLTQAADSEHWALSQSAHLSSAAEQSMLISQHGWGGGRWIQKKKKRKEKTHREIYYWGCISPTTRINRWKMERGMHGSAKEMIFTKPWCYSEVNML